MSSDDTGRALPLIDISPLRDGDAAAQQQVAAQLGAACRAHGFFYLRGHGLAETLSARLEALAREFFALPEDEKLRIPMRAGGRAWRGYFRSGGELTSGRPDWKEGLYLGEELPADDPRVRAGTPLHGANLWPARPAALREAVLAYLEAGRAAGRLLMRGIALSLALPAEHFEQHCTADPLLLFRLFNYPSRPAPEAAHWGVGEHTDYGLLTLLWQDGTGGLQVKTQAGWIDAPPLPGTLVCNIGDMLDRMTRGLYRSTPHRVRLNTSGRDRLSFPLFFDPGFFSRPQAIENLPAAEDDRASRWDQTSVHAFEGRYGDYLMAKIGKVFPELGSAVLR